jgi:NADH-quinone oxidoreductase subunit G
LAERLGVFTPDPTVTSHHGIAPSGRSGTVTFSLDGREVQAGASEFVIAAAERAGVFIPRFCYHPRMKPVGMCRMCLVEISGPRGATLQPACYVTVAEGMEVVTDSEKVRKAQDGVLEFLLVNHPLDCPVCDKGGECPLQDQTFTYGPGETRFVEEKRHWAKPIPLSELVLLDRERCIQCGRCVRFAVEIAGEAQIDFLGRGDQVEVNIFEDHAFTSYFSGNTVQICPVGALTGTPYRFGARPWDLEQVESTCTLCAFGCRAAVQSSAGRLTRLIGVDSDPVNQSWLCDKGRFGYESVNSEDRLTEPLLRSDASRDSELAPATWAEALTVVGERITSLISDKGPASIGVIGGARLSNEDAYAWSKLAKSVIGTDSVDAQIGDGLPPKLVLGLPRATLDEACAARCVVTLCGDLRDELPVLFLRLRGAVVERGLRLVEITSRRTSLTPYTVASLTYAPGEQGSIAGALASGADAPNESLGGSWDLAREAVGEDGEGVVVVVGRASLAESGDLCAEAARSFARAWPKARFLPALRRGNVMGALDMGLAPGVLPGRVGLEEGRAWFEAAWGSVPAPGLDTKGMLEALSTGDMSAVILLGSDPLGDFPDYTLASAALDRAELVVAVDAFLSPSAARADVVLPAASVHERSGTTTNVEGRVTRLAQKVVPPGQAWPDWMIAVEIGAKLGKDLGVDDVYDLWNEIERVAVSHAGITRAVLDMPGSRDGLVAPLAASRVEISTRPPQMRYDPVGTPGIVSAELQGAPLKLGRASDPYSETNGNGHAGDKGPSRPPLLNWSASTEQVRVPPQDSYSLRLVSPRRLYDDGVMLGACESLASLAPGATVHVNPHDLDRIGVASGGRVRVRSARAAVVLEAVADDTLARGLAIVPFNLDAGESAGAAALIDAGEPVTDVRLETP